MTPWIGDHTSENIGQRTTGTETEGMKPEVVNVVIEKITVTWDTTQCSLTDVYRYFGGTCCLHGQEKSL
jgi:hypothetical protein